MPDKGFERKTRAEIVSDMKSKARNLFGSDVNLAINSPLGILIELLSYPLAMIWHALAKLYNAYNIDTATGQDLDNLAKNIGITRIESAKARGEVLFKGDPDRTISEGFLVETPQEIQFETTETAQLDNNGEATVEVLAVEPGSETNVDADKITEIVNPLTGVDSVTNPDPTTGGRDRETDVEFRERYLDSLDRAGGSTVASIRAAIIQDTEAIAALVLENTSMEEDEDGLPPKSFEAIVLGGTDEEISKAIYDYKPGGIEPSGEENHDIEDELGYKHTIGFTRAEQVDIYVDITVVADSDVTEEIKEEIIRYIGGEYEEEEYIGLSMDKNVILSRINSRVMENIEDTTDIISTEIGTTPDDLQTDNIEIGVREVAITVEDNIEVEVQ